MESLSSSSVAGYSLSLGSRFTSHQHSVDDSLTRSLLVDGDHGHHVNLDKGDGKGSAVRVRTHSVSHGSMSVMGRQRVLQHAVAMVQSALTRGLMSYDFFGVYEGHQVANLCRNRLHKLLSQEMEEVEGGQPGSKVDWQDLMVVCFEKMENEIVGIIERGGLGRKCNVTKGSIKDRSSVKDEEKSIGSTAIVAVVGEEEIVVANCGNSRAILYRGDVVIPLTHDHKSDRPKDQKRFEVAIDDFRVSGVLATSKSMGDGYVKSYVITESDVSVYRRTETDNFLVIASDGLWDLVSNEVVCLLVKRCLQDCIWWNFEEKTWNNASAAAAMLVELAMARGSKDNISVIVVELRKHSIGAT